MNLLNLLPAFGILLHANNSNDICDFECWVKSLAIHIPPISYKVPVTNDKINMTNMILQNITIATLYTSFYPDATQINDGLLINVTLSAYLRSDLDYEGFIKTNGNISATITQINIQLPMKFIKDDDGLITDIDIYDQKKCKVTIDNIHVDMYFDNTFLDRLIKILIGPVVDIIKSNAQKIVCQTIQPTIKKYGSEFFTKIANYIRPYIDGPSSIEIPINSAKMTDLRGSQVIDLINFLLTNLTTGTTPLNLNSLVNRFSKETGIFDYQDMASLFSLPPELTFEIPVNVNDINATIKFALKSLVLSGLNTWKNFTILAPISPFVLDTTTSLDSLGINSTFQINITISGLVDTADVELSETAFFHMNMENNTLDFQLQYATEKGTGKNYTISQCTDPTCLLKLASPDGTGFKIFSINTSIGMIDLGMAEASIEEEIQETINTVCDFFIHNYRQQIPMLMNFLLNDLGRTYLNSAINDTLRTSECGTFEEEPYHEFGVTLTIIAVALSAVVLLALCVMTVVVIRIREKEPDKHKKFLSFFRNDSEASLFMHPKLPIWVRILIPFLICTNISLFLSSNGSIGASVFLKVHFGKDKKLEFPTIFDFALIKSIEDMWNAKAYILSMCVAIGSCVWPYTKLVLMLIVWIMPSTLITKKYRDRILRVLFELGKWSLIDSYFMILTVVGFHFVIDFPIVHEVTVNNQNILYIWVYPAYGFITLIIATIYSLALSHLICYINRKVSNPYDNITSENEGKSSVFKQQNLASKILLVIFLPFAFVLFLAGISVVSFSFEFDGLTGWALDILNLVNKKGYTVLEMIPKFPQSCEDSNSVRTRIIQVIYVITAVIAPILHIIALAVMLFVPMTKKQLFSMYNTCEVLYSWSCLDVFTVSIFISVVQIALLTDFMVGDNCDLINVVLKKFFPHDKYIDGHYKCFEIHSILENGTFLLIAAAIINTVAALWINAITRKVLEKDQDNEDYIRVNDPEVLLSSGSYVNGN